MDANQREEPTIEDAPRREPVQIITVRTPLELHAALKEEAHRRRMSLNNLCLEALRCVVP